MIGAVHPVGTCVKNSKEVGDRHFVSPGDKGNLQFRIVNSDFPKKRRAPCGTLLTSFQHNEASRIYTVKILKWRGPSILEDAWPRSKLSGNFPKGKVINREIGDSVDKGFNTFRHSKPRILIRGMTVVI
jgi:hypothetical protein